MDNSPVYHKTKSPASQKNVLKLKAQTLAAQSARWKRLFEISLLHNVEDWKVVSLMYIFDAGKNLSQNHFVFARVAKLLATTENIKVDENLNTKKDLVNWNRQAVLAMIEAVKLTDNDPEKIKRGYKTIELINILFPEFLLSE